MADSGEFPDADLRIGAVGEPGQRTFFVQVAIDPPVTLKAEKEQAALLAEELLGLLDRLSSMYGPDPVAPSRELALRPPVEASWAVGGITLDYDVDSDRVVVQFDEREADDEAGRMVRISLSRTRARQVADHTLEVVEQGRPECELCGHPKGNGHICARSNGKLR